MASRTGDAARDTRENRRWESGRRHRAIALRACGVAATDHQAPMSRVGPRMTSATSGST